MCETSARGLSELARTQHPQGTLRVNGGRLEFNGVYEGRLWIVPLHKDKKGRRLLKGRRQNGNKWELKEKK